MNTAALLTELVQCLHDESDALAAGDTQRLDDLSARKSALLARLAPQLRGAGGGSAAERAQLRRAQLLNNRNAELLAVRWNAVRARTDALLTAGRGEALYSAGGSVTAANRPSLARTFA